MAMRILMKELLANLYATLQRTCMHNFQINKHMGRRTTKQGDDFAVTSPAGLSLPQVAIRSGVEGRSPRRIFGGLLLLLPISTPTCS